MSVVTGQAIAEGGFSDMQDVSAFTPNLTVQDGFQGQTLLVRGIGTDTRNEAFEQAVAQFSDGVYYGRDNMALNGLFDLERLEVVRGPQPVFAGMSATAGAINSISRKPGDTLDGNVSVEYGDDEEMSVEAAIGGPITDTFGLRIAARYYDLPDAGYRQIRTGVEIGAQETKALALRPSGQPTENFDLTLKYEYQDVYQNGTPAEYGRCDLSLATSSGALAPVLVPRAAAAGLAGDVHDRIVYGAYPIYPDTTAKRIRAARSTCTTAIDYVNATCGTNYRARPIPRGLNNVKGIQPSGRPRT